jgi:pimeloyl-ACP methyl ester carboxylesterase
LFILYEAQELYACSIEQNIGERVPYVTNQGVQIYYEVVGDVPSLVLMHGGLSNLKAWYETAYPKTLKNDYKLVLIDIRGHGASDKPHDSKAYEMNLLVGDITAVLDDLNVDKADGLST